VGKKCVVETGEFQQRQSAIWKCPRPLVKEDFQELTLQALLGFPGQYFVSGHGFSRIVNFARETGFTVC